MYKELLAFVLFYKEMEADDVYSGIKPETMEYWFKEWKSGILMDNINVEVYYKEADELIKLFQKE